MAAQVAWMLRHAAFVQVLRRGYQAMLEVAEELGIEPRIHWLAAAHDYVEAFADDIDHAVAEVQVQFDLWVQRHEVGKGWHH